tara:strand:- start:2023 stop:3111 length:1089 start_codon:yes stop_codon:yes gene_type:complete
MLLFIHVYIKMILDDMDANAPSQATYCKWLKYLLVIASSTLLLPTNIHASEASFKPVVLFQGEVQPGSYLQLIEQGVARFEQNSGITVKRVHLAPNNARYLAELEQAAIEGYSPVLVQESNTLASFPDVALRYPSTRFISLDVAYHVPNVLGLTFSHAEGAYVIGYLAGLKTKTNELGFIGGVDVDVINQFHCGYELGARDANEKASVHTRYINKGAQSWEDTQGAKLLTENLMAENVDVIFPVAGFASLGVVETMKNSGHGYSFGIDYDYSQRYPNTTLASMEKKVDLAVYAALTQLKNGIWNGNHKTFGVKQGVISISLNNNNPDLTADDKKAVGNILLDLKGKSSVISQRIDQHCASST